MAAVTSLENHLYWPEIWRFIGKIHFGSQHFETQFHAHHSFVSAPPETSIEYIACM